MARTPAVRVGARASYERRMLANKLLHLVGATLLVGSLLGAVLATRVADGGGDAEKGAHRVLLALLRAANVGLVLLLVTGLVPLLTGAGAGAYMKQGWFHGMLTAFLLAGATAGMASASAKKLEAGKAEDPKSTRDRVRLLAFAGLVMSIGAMAAGVFRF